MVFSRRVADPFSVNSLSAALAARRSAGLPIINLAESNPTRVGFPANVSLNALCDPEGLRYNPDPRGLLCARKAVAALYSGVDPDDVFLCASTSEAYAWLFKLLCDSGDRVLVPKPGYPLFDYLAGLECATAAGYRLEYSHPSGWHLDRTAFAEAHDAYRPKAVVLIHPNNPTGSYILQPERDVVANLCAERGTALIVDEVFRRYGLDDECASSFASNGATRTLTFTLDGFSKMLALPQFKLGWIVVTGPDKLKAEALRRLEVIADTYLSVGAPIMHAAPALLEQADATVSAIRTRVRTNLAALRQIFEADCASGSVIASPYRVLRAGGGWTGIVEIPRVVTEECFALDLLNLDGVFVHPGYFFDFERECYVTVSLIQREELFSDGIARMRRRLDFYLT